MIRLRKTTLCRRMIGFLRWVCVYLYYKHSLKCDGKVFIGQSCRFIIHKGGRVKIGRNVNLADNTELQTRGYLSIGEKVTINRYSRIICYNKIEIGDNVVIAQFVSILDHDHRFLMQESNLNFEGYNTDEIKIGDNVWIGDKVTILKGVSIGRNVIIGAHSLVNKSIPDNCIGVGNPCKVVKEI